MKNIIDQDWFHPDIQWHQFDQEGNEVIMNRADILAGIDHWCNILREVADFGPGSTCVNMQQIPDIRYLTLMFAVWRMGGTIVSATVGPVAIPQFDCIVYNQHHVDDSWFNNVKQRTNNVIEADLWFNYTADTTQAATYPKINGTDHLLTVSFTNTSGIIETTSYTHEFFVALAQRQCELINLVSEDRVLHLHTIDHGGTEANVFLPALKYCQHHYSEIGKDLARHPKIAKLIQDEKISRVDCLGGRMIDNLLQTVTKFNHDVSFYLLTANFKSWLPLIREKNIKEIVSMFGSSLTVGPVLINKLTQTVSDDFDVLNYGKPLDDFYQVSMNDAHHLEVTNQYRGACTLADYFTTDDSGNFIFHHRDNYIRIQNVYVAYDFFEKLIAKHISPNLARLIPDAPFNQIYLMVDESLSQSDLDQLIHNINRELDNYSKHYKITNIGIVNLNYFLHNGVLAVSQVKLFFRQKFNLK
jgi:hypothetical protein